MPKLPGINHQRAVKAFEKQGFWIVRQGKHIAMTNGERILTIPRANPVDAYTLADIFNISTENLFPEDSLVRKTA